MSTENESWRDASGVERNEGADRDGNQYRGAGFGHSSYNRENRERPYRLRFNTENGGRSQKAYSSDRSYRPRFNAENGDRPQRSYGNAYRPRFNDNAEEGERSQRTYGGERSYRPRFNAEGGDRPHRPRFNTHNVLMAMREIVRNVLVSIRMLVVAIIVEETMHTAVHNAHARLITIRMPSIARRNRLNTRNSLSIPMNLFV